MSEYVPVVVIGAPRSGTNMLRDVLTHMPGFATWPCDEINYVWRHRNMRFASDELTPDLATTAVEKYVRKQFLWVSRKYGSRFVVEKTCANSLRVGFVDRIVPKAKYLFIHRNGLDVASSAVRRWQASMELPYLLRKARFVPLSDTPYYATRFAASRARKFFSSDRRLASWGPAIADMQFLLETHPLDEVCALQWQRCVELAHDAFSAMSASHYMTFSYENFVSAPAEWLERIMRFIDPAWKIEPDVLDRAVRGISPRNIGKGLAALDPPTRERLTALIGQTLSRFDYA